MQDLALNNQDIKNKIFTIRGIQVMLDRDLAKLYGVENIRLREQVKRNIERFPKDFMFQLTKEETEILVSQFAIPSKQHLGGHLPYVFTEQGSIYARRNFKKQNGNKNQHSNYESICYHKKIHFSKCWHFPTT